jgi:hypothetical protein
MKLRTRGNSIRLRLSRGDLATLLEHGVVEEQVGFPGGQVLRYRLERSGAPAPGASFSDGMITVRFPADAIDGWADPGEVSLEADCPIVSGMLHLLVEKDYQCLAPRDGEDDEDLFPNPGA